MSQKERKRRRLERTVLEVGDKAAAEGNLLQSAIMEEAKKAVADGNLGPGKVFMITVRHDDWCDLLKGAGPCNCNPEV